MVVTQAPQSFIMLTTGKRGSGVWEGSVLSLHFIFKSKAKRSSPPFPPSASEGGHAARGCSRKTPCGGRLLSPRRQEDGSATLGERQVPGRPAPPSPARPGRGLLPKRTVHPRLSEPRTRPRGEGLRLQSLRMPARHPTRAASGQPRPCPSVPAPLPARGSGSRWQVGASGLPGPRALTAATRPGLRGVVSGCKQLASAKPGALGDQLLSRATAWSTGDPIRSLSMVLPRARASGACCALGSEAKVWVAPRAYRRAWVPPTRPGAPGRAWVPQKGLSAPQKGLGPPQGLFSFDSIGSGLEPTFL